MQHLTLAERVAATRRVQAQNILNAAGDARYRRAFNTVADLKLSGWIVDVFDADDGMHVTVRGPKVGPFLCVEFEAPGDCRCTGTVDEDGSLSGEPLD